MQQTICLPTSASIAGNPSRRHVMLPIWRNASGSPDGSRVASLADGEINIKLPKTDTHSEPSALLLYILHRLGSSSPFTAPSDDSVHMSDPEDKKKKRQVRNRRNVEGSTLMQKSNRHRLDRRLQMVSRVSRSSRILLLRIACKMY